MKKLLLLSYAIFIIPVMLAQEGFIGVNLGRSIPGTDFASTSTLFSSGYAVPGFTIGFDGVWFPVPYAGLGGTIGFGSLYSDRDSYVDNFISYIDSHDDLISLNIPAGDQFSYRPAYWNFVNMMAGPELSLPAGRFRASAWIMGGMSIIISPRREILFDNGTDIINSYTKGTDFSFIYSYGAGIMYKLGSGTAVNLSAAYFKTMADYKFSLMVDSPVATLDEEKTASVDIRYLKLSLGLSYSF